MEREDLRSNKVATESESYGFCGLETAVSLRFIVGKIEEEEEGKGRERGEERREQGKRVITLSSTAQHR